MGRKLICCTLGLALVVIATLCSVARGTDYKDALSKSILYYEAQRSGPLPAQRVTWRADSGLQDGKAEGIDLTGGYYDAGDNVKFGLPMAFTATMLSWSVVEYRAQLAAQGELQHALEAIKWATDYFIKAHPEPNVLYGEVGDGESDHLCWMRPEDMTTPRVAYKIDTENPGSDLAGETAAALAAASIVFKRANPSYSGILLTHAKQLFSFADTYRGKYDDSINVVRNFYASRSGYADELLWAAIWLYKATGEEFYLKYVADNAGSLGGSSWAMKEFSWDVKYAGVQVLVSQVLLGGKGGYYANTFKQYQQKAEYFLCAQLQGNYGGDNTDRTPGGLLYVRQWNNMQYVSAASFLLAVYSDYLPPTGQVHCPAGPFSKAQLFSLAKSQADYILGHNPRSTSYMVGFGTSYAKHVHHRGASIVSYKENRALVGCKQGYSYWYSRSLPNPNTLVGALVGGPDENDNFADERTNYEQTEPATYNNGPLVGLLARLAGAPYGSQSADVKPPANTGKPKPSPKRKSALAPPKPKTKPIPPPGKPAPKPGQKPAPKPGKKPAPKPGNKPAPKPGKKPSPKLGKKPSPKLGKKPSPKPSPKPYVPAKVNILITQKKDATWHADGKVYNKYVATVTNKSKKSVKELVLRIKGYRGELFGLTKIGKGSNWVLPHWGQVLSPGQSYSFIIVQAAPPPVIVVRKYVVA